MAFQSPNYTDRTINDFKSRLVGGGSRPNLFECEVNFPEGLGLQIDNDFSTDLRFMVKSAQLPGSTISSINIPFRGRNLKIAGDRTFDPWSITVINDTNFSIRNAFEKWMNYMNRHDDNAGVITPATYQREMVVHQLGRGVVSQDTTGVLPSASSKVPILKSYKFYGCFPTEVTPIELSYDSSDTIEEFGVTMQVQWWDAFNDEGEKLFGTTEPGGSIPNISNSL
jgi:hypothetical protein